MSKVVYTGAARTTSTNSTRGRLKLFPKQHLMLITAVSIGVLTLIGLVPSSDVKANKTNSPLQIDAFVPLASFTTKELAQSDLLTITQPDKSLKPNKNEELRFDQKEDKREANAPSTLGRWQIIEVQTGDNLSNLFSKQGLSARTVYDISQTPKHGRLLTDIRPGQTLKFRVNSNNELTQFHYIQDRLNSIFFKKDDAGYTAEAITLEPEIRAAFSEGVIKNSLFLASQKAGLTNKLTMELANIFGWDIDFVSDIREGDRFNVLYEERYLDDKKLDNGNILSASFTNQGKTYTAIRYTDSKGNTSYYSPDGKSMKKAFLRTPVEFTRISSSFNPNRLHPIFKTKRPHRAVDYAAPSGTPIRAAGDGRIQFSGWQNGYGNVVYIEHPNNVVTIYAHQSKVNRRFKKGSRVSQGDIIGYVGQTGWATGPHLHYEFRVNGVHRNPMTVKLPDATPIPKEEMARFKQHTAKAFAKLEQHQGTVLAAQ